MLRAASGRLPDGFAGGAPQYLEIAISPMAPRAILPYDNGRRREAQASNKSIAHERGNRGHRRQPAPCCAARAQLSCKTLIIISAVPLSASGGDAGSAASWRPDVIAKAESGMCIKATGNATTETAEPASSGTSAEKFAIIEETRSRRRGWRQRLRLAEASAGDPAARRPGAWQYSAILCVFDHRSEMHG